MLIGIYRWIISLGQIDIMFATVSLSRFQACPKEAHINRMLCIAGYLKKYCNHLVCMNAEKPMFDEFEKAEVSWIEQYPNVREEELPDAPKLHGEPIVLTCYIDSNHAHGLQNVSISDRVHYHR